MIQSEGRSKAQEPAARSQGGRRSRHGGRQEDLFSRTGSCHPQQRRDDCHWILAGQTGSHSGLELDEEGNGSEICREEEEELLSASQVSTWSSGSGVVALWLPGSSSSSLLLLLLLLVVVLMLLLCLMLRRLAKEVYTLELNCETSLVTR